MFGRHKSSRSIEENVRADAVHEKRRVLMEIGNSLSSRIYNAFFVKRQKSIAVSDEITSINPTMISSVEDEGTAGDFLYCNSPLDLRQEDSSQSGRRDKASDFSELPYLEGGEYKDDVFRVLLSCEKRCFPEASYVDDMKATQSEISPNMRAILMDWLVEVAEEYKLSNETLHLACNYIDRFLSRCSVSKKNLQLLGVVCLLVASKYEEKYPPHVDEFVYITDNTYTKEEVLSMEMLVMKVLKFSFTAASSYQFASIFGSWGNLNEVVKSISFFLCDLSLVDFSLSKYLPSDIATAAVCLARLSCNECLWDDMLAELTHKRMEDVLPCLLTLRRVWEECAYSKLQAVRVKYHSPKYHYVSSRTPPTLDTNE
ncbi:Cyclin-A2 [Galdieria sulphuraria]|uniref:Cyclin A n=1 Tax=Galdieria sulphuraria TaxID=130081 RepID=M2Y4K1_GALSU|nr:cyclin A [Galdieria sulphuraria]EME30853.1 cyclin A [Galdieria sulphuraria]GJD08206.1 Cyclin-A2 [Galdieria sulphuraria]|eukprot:XP_005707373.1 cyclin A [Galdieria sulphuraria]